MDGSLFALICCFVGWFILILTIDVFINSLYIRHLTDQIYHKISKKNFFIVQIFQNILIVVVRVK